MSLAPIILFTYNRAKHTEATLDALAQNTLAADSVLYIYCDGAKENADENALQKIKAARKIVANEKRFKSVELVYQEHNKGLANSIIQGVSAVVKEHGKVIVLEDDIVTTPSFLTYMNQALDLYENDDKVFSISGYKPPSGDLGHVDSFFLPFSFPWGWAVWQKSWEKFKPDNKDLKRQIDQKNLQKEMDNGYYAYYQMLLDDIAGKLNSWFVRFYAYHMLNDGLCLYPNISLTRNIGFDDSGEHCDTGEDYFTKVPLGNVYEIKKKYVGLDKKIWRIHKREFWKRNPNLNFANRVFRKLTKVFYEN